ncbi:MAG: hypothetical protein AAF696_08505 [Bacteroidota bacterium]
MKQTLLIFTMTFCFLSLSAQKKQRRELGNFAMLTGLHQPLVLQGGNVAFNYTSPNGFTLEASFGIFLDYKNVSSNAEKNRYKSIRTPFSYGIGLGYFYKGFSLNFEPKATMFNIKDFNDQEINYTTWSLGGGWYYNLFLWEGLFLQPSVRYWHKIGSTLPNGQFQMTDKFSEQFTHEARKPGANGWIYGVSAGYYFD